MALAGCTCHARTQPVQRDDDATRPLDAHSVEPPDRERFLVLGREIVDLAEKKVVHVLDDEPERLDVDAHGAYFWRGHHLFAIDLPSGRRRWSYDDLSPEALVGLHVDDRRLVVGWQDAVFAFDRETGERTEIVRTTKSASIEELAVFGDAVVVLLADGNVSVVDPELRRVTKLAPPAGTWTLLRRVAVMDTTFATLEADAPPGKVVVHAFDDRGGARWTAFLAASGATVPVQIEEATDHHLLLSAGLATTESIALRATDGAEDMHLVRRIGAIVENDSGAIEWALARTAKDDGIDAIDPKSGAMKWSASLNCVAARFAVATRGPRLFVAGFTPADGGGCIAAIDRKTGAVAWSAELSNPLVPHSKYWNDVSLRMRGDEVIAVGREAGADHVDVFSASSGERRWSHVVRF